MMVSMEVYLRRGQRKLRGWIAIPPVSAFVRFLAYGLGGFLLSAARAGFGPLPLSMGLCCNVTGWRILAAGLGSAVGYLFFWQTQGIQGILWATMGSLLALVVNRPGAVRNTPLFMPALVCFLTCLTGFLFQVFGLEEIPFAHYALRVFLAGGSVWLFDGYFQRRNPVFRWLCTAAAALAVAQITPLPGFNLGYLFFGWAVLQLSIPTALMIGLGLDLSGTAPASMCAAACLICCMRKLPDLSPPVRMLIPCGIYIVQLMLSGSIQLEPIPGLLLGCTLGAFLPPRERKHRPGSTGHAQVQLELTAGILADIQQLLLEIPPPILDAHSLLDKVRLHACTQCTLQRDCREKALLTTHHLHQPLDFSCRRPLRIQTELRLGREQLLSLQREKERLQEYRLAMVQQYQFLSSQLRTLSDNLQNHRFLPGRYHIQVSARSRSKSLSNGDLCSAFPGSRCRCYVLLCDGMGTGTGAAHEAQLTSELLKNLLTAGFSAEQAVRSINSLLILRGQAGAVTLDLAEIHLNTGRVILYKWGASPSWLLNHKGLVMIGSPTPPPGISVQSGKPATLCLSLHQEETLILVSDGVHASEAALRDQLTADMPPGDLAGSILRLCRGAEEDDATVAAIRLLPRPAKAMACS